ncbi:MAG: sigma-54 dependent transcriptional regulator [Proteobacteria bacterium]|nr:sigma-54 dependent transcriptional regulator [Pseudomonadota bacterium]MBU1736729.1 sigma-54 dependent transcriptional regulator [Pseudomonadota bacterium]
MSNVLIVDDDRALCRTLEIHLGRAGHTTFSGFDISTGKQLLDSSSPDLVLLDVNLPDANGLEALPSFLQSQNRPSVIIMTGNPDNKSVVEAMRAGAFDYIRKPIDLDDVLLMFEKVERHRAAVPAAGSKQEPTGQVSTNDDMIGSHPAVLEVHKLLGLLSRSRISVLIQGETGTGKELAARILHQAGAAGHPFVAINCSAVVPTLLESEFFGHEKGAFTGADSQKIGKLEFAKEGTVFLDEIGDLPLDLQGKLLRVIQEEEFVRVGGLSPIPLKARVVSATHCDLQKMVRDGSFRQDLFYRLAVSTISMPPLRERRSDIPLLVPGLLKKVGARLNQPPLSIDDKAMAELISHDWPGNVRELENILTRAAALAKSQVISNHDLNFSLDDQASGENCFHPITLKDAERIHIEKTLLANGWNISKAARLLDVSPTTLRKKISDFQLTP